MKKYLILYKPFLLFSATFFMTYIVLTFIYQGYLSSFKDNQIDGITEMAAKNTAQLAQFLGVNVTIQQNDSESFIRLFYNQKYIARMTEGCNAISVIILFVSFVASFSGKLKPTVLFILGGSLVVYFLNIVRIASLCVLMYYFPEYQPFLHDVVFPLFIYGVVFFLWVLWVIKFSSYVNNTAQT